MWFSFFNLLMRCNEIDFFLMVIHHLCDKPNWSLFFKNDILGLGLLYYFV